MRSIQRFHLRLALAGTAILLLGGGAQSAYAGYIVSTSVFAASSVSDFGQAYYNVIGPGAHFATAGSGTANGTTDTTGTLTASTDTAAVSGLDGGTAFAAADLSTGALKASSLSGGPNGIRVSSVARYGDVLHFVISGAGPSTITDIGIHFTLDGSMSVGSGPGAVVDSIFQFGTASLVSDLTDTLGPEGSCPPLYSPCIASQTQSGWVSSSFASNTPGSIEFNAVYALTGASANIDISNYLDALGQSGGDLNLDYSHTSLVGLSLPANVSFTSDSGVFDSVSSGPAGVPEPPTFALIGLGLLLSMGGLRLRKRNPTH